MQRSTIKDVAKLAGVSLATVSYVMNGRGRVTNAVALRVRAAATELGYAPSRTAMALKTGQHHVIGCLLPVLANPIFGEIAVAIQTHAAAAGYATVVINTKDDPKMEAFTLENFASHGIDGVIAVLNGGFQGLKRLPRFPVIALDAPYAQFDSVCCDHVEGGRLMARKAHELGHRQIGLLRGPIGMSSADARWSGLCEEAERLGVDILWQHEVALEATLDDPARAAIARRDVTLVACVNDLVAVAALGATRELGLRVPQELSVIGFDDMAMSAWPLIALSTIRQPIDQIAADAVAMLIRRLAQPDLPIEERILPVEAVMRSTSQARLRITF